MGANKLKKFKNKKISIALVLLIAVIPFFTTAEDTDSDMLVHLKGLRMSTDFAESPEQDGRIREMEVEALSIGTIAGSYYASKKINELLDKRASYLDVTFDFHDSVISYKGAYILPPVISERKNDTEIVGGKTFTVKRQVYSMETSPRFVYEVPTWRNYLLLTPVKPQQPDNSLLPRSKDEVALWEKNIEKGWSTGVRQAIYVVNGRYAKLTRDLVGLDRYHLLVAAKIVSEPVIKHSYTPVSGGGYEMSIEDSVVEIQVNPLLNTDRFNWQSIPRLPDVSGLFPRGIFSETDLEIANDE
jgi:defect-in-organelle-trafficking protein DotC